MHGTDRLVGDGAGLAGDEPGDTEIRHLNAAVGKQHDILRLDVAVDNPLGMGMHEGAEDLGGEMHRFLDADHPLLLDIILERNAVDIFHDDVLERGAVTHVEDLDDVRVIEQGDRAGLVAEASAEFLVVEVFLTQYFDCHDRAGVEVLRLVNDSHTAVAYLFEYFIPAVQDFSDILIHID